MQNIWGHWKPPLLVQEKKILLIKLNTSFNINSDCCWINIELTLILFRLAGIKEILKTYNIDW